MGNVFVRPSLAGQQNNPGAEYLASRGGGGSADTLQFLGLGSGQSNRWGDARHAQHHTTAGYNIKHLVDGALAEAEAEAESGRGAGAAVPEKGRANE